MNIYELQCTCTCPSDKKGDVYKVIVESRRLIWTERIGDECSRLAEETISQECFTTRLSRALGAKVTTIHFYSKFIISIQKF